MTLLAFQQLLIPPVFSPLSHALVKCTGQLGDVFRESATIAHTYARSYLASKDAHNKFLTASAVHVHVPQVRICACFIIVLHFVSRCP